ncbi:uncharacterized protein LOC135492905 [Lineus longissimus]|uniref:uncharacterized protein LOC135492905 n=1 Tax=Lineus longissimus TaxID=88925 RepID=UPI002B4CA2A6
MPLRPEYRVMMYCLGFYFLYTGLRSGEVGATPIPPTPTIDVLKDAPKDYKKDCHKDQKLPWNAPDNYLDCKKDFKMRQDNKLDCCIVDKDTPTMSWNCCNPDDKFPGDANIIWSLMGIIGGILIIGTWLYNWFNKDSFPCLTPYQDRIDEVREKVMFYLTCMCLRKNKEEDAFVKAGEPRRNEDGLEETGRIPEDDFNEYYYSNAVY